MNPRFILVGIYEAIGSFWPTSAVYLGRQWRAVPMELEKTDVPKVDSVRCSTHAYTAAEPRDVIISFRITRTLADRIEDHRKLRRKRQTKTEIITDLLEKALFIMEKAQKLDDPILVKYFQENLYNVQMVDDIMEWPQDRVEAIIGVLASERERRFRLRLGKH